MEEKIIRKALQSITDPVTGAPISTYLQAFQWQSGTLTVILEYTQPLNKTEQNLVESTVMQALNKLDKVQSVQVILTNIQHSPASPKKERAHPAYKPKHRPSRIKNIILVASGKGGVGKSTVAANLAVSLMKLGYKVGLLDADIYGPSVPQLFGINQQPTLTGKLMHPIQQYGIALMSMGFLVEPNTAAVWRGPMVTKALYQLLMQTDWGQLDYLIIDTPPGTGDVHLSLGENYEIEGAIVVTTPQELAVIDAIKAVDMFNKLHIPVLGIVENMSYLVVPGTQQPVYVFGQAGGKKMAHQYGLPLLVQLPLTSDLAYASDQGMPLTYTKHETEVTTLFTNLAKKVAAA